MANSARRNGDSDSGLFLAAIAGALPLTDRDRAKAPAAGETRAAPTTATANLSIDRDGDRVEGRAHGVSRKQLADLRAGRIGPEATLDLHHRDAARARRDLLQFLDNSVNAGRRCVLVIHGRGLHSTGGPVLKDRVVDWLATWPGSIRGFCSARSVDGGAGAVYVQLTR